MNIPELKTLSNADSGSTPGNIEYIKKSGQGAARDLMEATETAVNASIITEMQQAATMLNVANLLTTLQQSWNTILQADLTKIASETGSKDGGKQASANAKYQADMSSSQTGENQVSTMESAEQTQINANATNQATLAQFAKDATSTIEQNASLISSWPA